MKSYEIFKTNTVHLSKANNVISAGGHSFEVHRLVGDLDFQNV